MSLLHWVPRGTETPKDRDEVDRRDVSECDGWVCVLKVIGAPSIFKLIRKTVVLSRVLLILSFTFVESRFHWLRGTNEQKNLQNLPRRNTGNVVHYCISHPFKRRNWCFGRFIEFLLSRLFFCFMSFKPSYKWTRRHARRGCSYAR